MEDDVIKVSSNCVNSSSLLTDWLFKYKLDNISYLSSPQSIHVHITKNSRKGGLFDSRDIIRPTVQLFKNIKNKNKRRNETPSPQRTKPKANAIPSPTKESNRIFNHKGAGEYALDNYRKIYTYGKVKQDKVSRDKIESAVALYRQREQEKENSANRPPPEKFQSKRGENKEVISSVPKSRRGTNVNKPTTNESTKNPKTPCKTEEKHQKECQDIKTNSTPKLREKTAQSGDSKKNEEIGDNEAVKKCLINPPNKVKKKNKITKTKEIDTKNQKDNLTEGEENNEIDNCNKDSSTLKLNKKSPSSRSIQTLNKLNSENQTEKSQINVIDFMKDLEIKSQSRASLIKSLKSKSSQKEFNKSSPEVLFNKKLSTTQLDKSAVHILSNRKLPTADYIIIKPAFISNDAINVPAGVKPKIKKSVEDLLREYRIKYRNMIKLR